MQNTVAMWNSVLVQNTAAVWNSVADQATVMEWDSVTVRGAVAEQKISSGENAVANGDLSLIKTLFDFVADRVAVAVPDAVAEQNSVPPLPHGNASTVTLRSINLARSNDHLATRGAGHTGWETKH